LRLADGTPPTQARFVVKPAFTWVGNTDVTTDWTTLTGNYTVPTDAEPDQLSVYFGTADITDVPTYTYFLDDITITTTPADDCEPGEPADPVTIVSTDFEDDTWTDSWSPSGDVTLTVVDDGGDRVLQVDERGTDFAGIETAAGLLAALAPGDTASLTAELRLADGTPPTQARFVVKPAFTWVANTDVTTDWTTLTGDYTVPTDAEPDQLSVYFGTADITDVPTYTYLLDDITITTTPAD